MAVWRSARIVLGLAACYAGLAFAEVKVPEMEAKHAATEKPAPELSVTARQLKISGHVELTVKINESGVVTDVRIDSGNPILTSSCVSAVKRWKFKPFTHEGAASAAVTTLSFDFKQ